MKNPKAIIFDLDDTISSYDTVCGPAWIEVCERFTATHKVKFTVDELLGSIEKVKKWYWAEPDKHKWGREHLKEARREVTVFALEALGLMDRDAAYELGDDYTVTQDSMIALLPGSIEALRICKELGIRMVVLTNGQIKGQRGKIERFGIGDFFEHIFIDMEIGYSKPDVHAYEYVLEKLALEKADVWMVGDNLNWDVFGAQNTGLFAVWNDYRGDGLPFGSTVVPDMIVHSILELAQWCKDNSETENG